MQEFFYPLTSAGLHLPFEIGVLHWFVSWRPVHSLKARPQVQRAALRYGLSLGFDQHPRCQSRSFLVPLSPATIWERSFAELSLLGCKLQKCRLVWYTA